jgi:diguanylate cyclase (GGDEF)-like protein
MIQRQALMNDSDRTKEQLSAEVAELRRRVAQLEQSAIGKSKDALITPRDCCDAITGLPSRFLFDQHLSIITASASNQVQKFALMLFCVGHFEENSYFHSRDRDNRLLKGVANRLKYLLRKSDILIRTENNDFLILLPDVSWMGISARIAPRIINSFQKPFMFDEQAIRIFVNIGIALYPDDGTGGDSLVEYSRIAMNRAAKDGPNSYRFYGKQKNGNPCSVSSDAT